MGCRAPPGDLPYPGTEPESLESPALAGEFFTTEPPGNPIKGCNRSKDSESVSLYRNYHFLKQLKNINGKTFRH